MYILITVTILFVTALVLLVLQFAAPGFRYNWLIATGGALLGWLSVFAWQIYGLPFRLEFPPWQPELLFLQSPKFFADELAWTFAISLATMCLAIILTAVVRSNFPRPINWTGTLILTGLGILAVVAENPLTLVLIWAAIDISELVTQMRVIEEPALSERAVIAFASRAAGILVLLWAGMVSIANGQVLDFREAPPQVGLYLVLAAGLRIGVLPLHLPYSSESSLRRGFGTGLRLISAASSLILLARIPAGSLDSPLTPYLLILTSLAAVYGGWMWLRAPDELNGRAFWLIGMSSLAVAAALRANPIGAAAWGCAIVLTGGALFLSSEPNKWLLRALFIGAWGISSLPFSLTATGWTSSLPASWLIWLVWPFRISAQAMLIAGFIRHSQRTTTRLSNEDQPIWARNVYPIGISLLLLMTILLGFFGWSGALQIGNWIAGLLASLLALGVLSLTPRLRILNPVRAHWVRPVNVSWLDWSYQILWSLYRQLRRVSDVISNVLEGESGIMWTLLFLVLFISFFTQGNP
ncbi:MAG TPA: hypothetical protein VK880_06755 [Anaerolineales bacterium]|nr:hypothetical protein [Anaerolineales bacterium]